MTEREVEELAMLKRKVEELLGRYVETLNRLDGLRSEKEELERRLRERESEQTELENKYNKLQLSGAIKGDEESTLIARKRINKMVREIDNCIALLNNI
jgi:predicted nuclease with TOPRIM domain